MVKFECGSSGLTGAVYSDTRCENATLKFGQIAQSQCIAGVWIHIMH